MRAGEVPAPPGHTVPERYTPGPLPGGKEPSKATVKLIKLNK